MSWSYRSAGCWWDVGSGRYQRGEDEWVIEVVRGVGVGVPGCLEERWSWGGGERLLLAEGGAGKAGAVSGGRWWEEEG